MTVQFVTCIGLSIALGACTTMAQAPEAANSMTPHGAMTLERLDTLHAKMKLIPEGVWTMRQPNIWILASKAIRSLRFAIWLATPPVCPAFRAIW